MDFTEALLRTVVVLTAFNRATASALTPRIAASVKSVENF